MQVQKKESVQGDFVKVGEDLFDGDIIYFANEGKEVQGDFGMFKSFKVKVKNGEIKDMAINQTSINNLVDVYGTETQQWLNKPALVWIIKQMVSGTLKDVVYLTLPGLDMNGIAIPAGQPGALNQTPQPVVPGTPGAAQPVPVSINPNEIPPFTN